MAYFDGAAHEGAMSLSQVQSVTLTFKSMLPHVAMPYFPGALRQHGGFFLRFPAPAGAEVKSMLGRITEVRPCQPYRVRGSYACDLLFYVDSMPQTPLRLGNVSNEGITQDELDLYKENLLRDEDDAEEFTSTQLPALKKLWDKEIVNRTISSPAEAQAIIKRNTELNRAATNPLFHVGAMQRRLSSTLQEQAQRASQAGSAVNLDATQALEASPTQLSMLDETGRATTQSFSGFDDPHSPGPMAPPSPRDSQGTQQIVETVDGLSDFLNKEQRVAESNRLRDITLRNKHRNDVQIVRAAENFKKQARQSRLQEATLLWEVDDAKRQQLCDDFDAAKEGKDPAEQKPADAADKDAEAVQTPDPAQARLERSLSVHSELNVSVVDSIPEELLFMGQSTPGTPMTHQESLRMSRIPSRANVGAVQKRHRAEGMMSPPNA